MAIVVFDGAVLADVFGPAEIFGRVRRADGTGAYELRICSAKPNVRTAHVKLSVPYRLDALRHAEVILVPGAEALSTPTPESVVVALRRAARRGATVASVCTGAFLLAQTGLLDGRSATTHWQAAAELARRFPKVRVDPNVLYVDEGKVVTSAGAAAGLDMCLHLIRRELGAVAAANAARAAVMPLERAGGQAQFIVHEAPVAKDASMDELLHWLEANLPDDLSLHAIARRAGMSTRTLSRRFLEKVGTTPAAWVNFARVRRAQRLLETTAWSIERVAEETGFGSATVLREHFGRQVGSTPTSYRRALHTSERA